MSSADPPHENELIPTSPLSWTLIALTVVVSIGGIFWAAASNDPVGWGGRGGALGVAISFCLLFVRETLVENRFVNLLRTRELAQHLAPQAKLTEPVDVAKEFVIYLERKSAAQTRQNVSLAVVGALATLAWGFGDWPAVGMYPWFHGGKNYTPPTASVSGAAPSPAPSSGTGFTSSPIGPLLLGMFI